MAKLAVGAASGVQVSANAILFRDNKVFVGWVNAPANIN
jgi:hypothetical protein